MSFASRELTDAEHNYSLIEKYRFSRFASRVRSFIRTYTAHVLTCKPTIVLSCSEQGWTKQGDCYVVNSWTEQVNWGHELYVTVRAAKAMYVI